jgi:hypothetical protein
MSEMALTVDGEMFRGEADRMGHALLGEASGTKAGYQNHASSPIFGDGRRRLAGLP